MNTLRLVIFAEFFLVALLVPAVTIPGRRIFSRLAKVFVALAVATGPLVAAVHIWVPVASPLEVVYVQLLLAAFAAAVAGASILAGRFAIYGGPACVGLLAVALLTTPFWGDALLNLHLGSAEQPVQRWLVASNPLFNASEALGFDWVHSDGRVLYYPTYGGYKMTRIGEYFPAEAAPTWRLGLLYVGIGLVASGVAGLVRPHGRPPDYMFVHEHLT